MNKRLTGVHLRIENSYSGLLESAHKLDVNSCQFFFIPQSAKKYLKLTKEDKQKFLELKKKYFPIIFAHSSYWVNAATGNKNSSEISQKLLKKEIAIAKQLEIEYLVMHGGSAKKFPPDPSDPMSRQAGISAVAKIINNALEDEDQVTILVENTTHGGKTVCSDLQDFVALRAQLTHPERVKFCLDTAHAFAYGYDLQKTEKFIKLLDQTMGLENIKLIHYNDSAKPCGSKIDQHALPGEGLIGKDVLLNIVNHPKLQNIPLIVEPPEKAAPCTCK